MSTLKELRGLGAFIPDKPIKKEIKFKLDSDDEISASIHVKRLSIGDYESLILNETDTRSRTAKMISSAITLGDDGKERISFEDAYRLHPSLAGAMISAFNEVNSSKKS